MPNIDPDEPQLLTITDFEKYVGANGNPLMAPDGRTVYEREVIAREPRRKARQLLRVLFNEAVEQDRARIALGISPGV